MWLLFPLPTSCAHPFIFFNIFICSFHFVQAVASFGSSSRFHISFPLARYSVLISISAGNTSDLREILLIMAAHMLVGLFAKHGVVSFQSLKSIYQRIK
jgi:hypothetical protein